MIDYRPLILTVRLPARVQDYFQAIRLRHFPIARNHVPAHVTMFHHLPGAELDAIVGRLKSICRGTPPPHIEVAGLRSLGRGVAYRLHSPALEALRDELAHAWAPLLLPQDQQGFAPHITIQNKVEPRAARVLLDELRANFKPWSFDSEGLQLWRYLDGPWALVSETRFS